MLSNMKQEDKFDYFKIEDNFKEIEGVDSILIFGNENKEIPKITFAIPTYRRARTLKETIDSVVTQKGKHKFDIVIIDNNPERNDETEQLMKKYESIENIRYYKNTCNVGMAGNWNKCLVIPKTEWVVLLHDDDLVRDTYLNNIVPCLDGNIDLIIPNLTGFNDGEVLPPYTPSRYILLREKKLSDLFLGNNAPSGIVLRKSKVIELGGYTKKNFAPDIFLAKMLYYGHTYSLEKSIVLYRKGLNESTKLEAMTKMCELNHEFREQAWPIMGMPRFLVKYGIPYCDWHYEHLFITTWNKDFRFYGMQKYTSTKIIMGKVICTLYNLYFRVLKKIYRKTKRIKIYGEED